MSGMHRSSSTTSYDAESSLISSSPAAADPAVSTLMPQASSWPSSTIRFVALSSTTSARRPSRLRGPAGRVTGWSAASRIGSRNQNVLPWPGSLSTPIVPPMAVVRRAQMARPSPVPP